VSAQWNESEQILDIGDVECTGGTTVKQLYPDTPRIRFRLLPWCSSASFRGWRARYNGGAVAVPPDFETEAAFQYEERSSAWDRFWYEKNEGVIFSNYGDSPVVVTIWTKRSD
jgi:hypothetical protein